MSLNNDFSVSVLLSLIRTENPKFLDECIDSLFKQTFQPSEIVLVIEGELDKDHNDVIYKWKSTFKPGQFKTIHVPAKTGFPGSLNAGLMQCNSNYVARMDTDDICLPERFEKQIKFLIDNPDITVLGSYINEYDNDFSEYIGMRIVPIEHNMIIKFARFRSPFNHQTVMYKLESVKNLNGYPLLKSNEDYGLWGLLFQNGYKGANIPQSLVNVRAGKHLYQRRKGKKYLKGELQTLKFLHSIKFYSLYVYVINVMMKSLVRYLPVNLVGFLYLAFFRKKRA